ncbi:MAG: purine-nucleoside phosphorylase, partial [Spirochaetaceae bacterium]|nr:purine-nucleoside phosphorylase [Spirochaetaceae bacterium]
VGTCGAVNPNVKLREVILAMSACTDSSLLTQRFGSLHFAPTADFDLLMKAYESAKTEDIKVEVGSVASSDLFYDENENWKLWAKYGVKGIEMETAELYTLAAKFNRQALSILTVSDNIATGEATSSEERQSTFTTMMKIALETAIK